MAYTQTLPPGGSRSIAQFQFETNTLDSSGFGNNGFAVGIPGLHDRPHRTGGHARMARTVSSSFRRTWRTARPSLLPRGFIGTAARHGSAFLISAMTRRTIFFSRRFQHRHVALRHQQRQRRTNHRNHRIAQRTMAARRRDVERQQRQALHQWRAGRCHPVHFTIAPVEF